MIDRLVGFLFRLLALIGPQASESIDLGDDMDSLPYIPDSPADVIAEPRGEEEDEDASDPSRKGISHAAETILAAIADEEPQR
jgi:hypothetical protein